MYERRRGSLWRFFIGFLYLILKTELKSKLWSIERLLPFDYDMIKKKTYTVLPVKLISVNPIGKQGL